MTVRTATTWWICLALLPTMAKATDKGLLAQWTFDEGKGNVAQDSSGNGHNATLHGAQWHKHGRGFSIYLDGFNDYVDCGQSQAIGIGGPITLEAWVQPTRKAHGESHVLGESMATYGIYYYNSELCNWYIGHGTPITNPGADFTTWMGGHFTVRQWSHVVATYDGKFMSLWLNGRLAQSQKSAVDGYKPEQRFRIATPSLPGLPQFKGLVDNVRVYNRALSGEEASEHFKSEASEYGFNPAWFNRVKVSDFHYPNRNKIIVEADYRGLQPLHGNGHLVVTLSHETNVSQIIQRQLIDNLPRGGLAEAKFDTDRLAPGTYIARVTLEDERGKRPVEQLKFLHPAPIAMIPDPSAKQAGPLPPDSGPTMFEFSIEKSGGFTVTINKKAYPFQTRISWPHGQFNYLGASKITHEPQEKNWRITATEIPQHNSSTAPHPRRYEVKASGDFYTINRNIEVFATHAYIKDTYTNITEDDLGLLIYNETSLQPDQITGSWLSGHDRRGRQADLAYPDHGPTVFFTDEISGMGIIPIDDVYVVQAVPYADWQNAAGVGTERFALAPGKSYTLEWAIYPTGSGDYYDFINTFRKVENRIGTVSGAPGFFTHGARNRHQVPTNDFLDKRGMKIGIIHWLLGPVEDRELDIEGIEFMDYPQERRLIRSQAQAIHRKHPGFKVIFHVAHSLYATNNPDRFADSKVILADGSQAIWADPTGYMISKRRQEEGWHQYVFYPTPGNSFHDWLMKSVDVMMDEIGMDGAFMDGFLYGMISRWTHDGRWDGHSAIIDPETKTITQKIGSVLLLSQPSMIQFARKVRDKGGVIVVNNSVMTRSIASEKYIIFDNECASGPELHLAPTVTALARPPFSTEKQIYLDMLDKLSWGELFMYYQERMDLTYPSLASRQFPITFEEIRAGLVRGKERIVTMNSGVYGWPGDRSLHMVYKYDSRGAMSNHDFITTVNTSGVRTDLQFSDQESAVIEPIPVWLESTDPVNVLVQWHKDDSLKIILNGQGLAELSMFVGTAYYLEKRDGKSGHSQGVGWGHAVGGFSVPGAGAAYHVTVANQLHIIHEIDGILTVPLTLNGQVEVNIHPNEVSDSNSRSE